MKRDTLYLVAAVMLFFLPICTTLLSVGDSMTSFFRFFKRQSVFCISTLCALISCFFVPLSASYLSYFDWNTLALLFSLMAAVSGFEKCGVFSALASKLTGLVHTTRSLSCVLVFLCFFTSMFITNDVALLTFVPFALLLFSRQNTSGRIILFVIILQTVAANTGSMLTPVGNPQNIFLAEKMGVSIPSFMKIVFPYSLASFLLLCVLLLFVPATALSAHNDDTPGLSRSNKMLALMHTLLFSLCLASVAGIFPKLGLVPVVFAALLLFDRTVIFRVDWWLLLTFCAFFVFSGNIAAIPAVSEFLHRVVSGHEFISSLAASQIISNVPATVLLYPFIQSASELLIGVNAGGLGTLVASLASLISFKLYTKERSGFASFLLVFTIINIVFLVVLCALHFLLNML